MGDSQKNRQRLLLALGALGAIAAAPNASALEFGRISLDSHLNQPLAATVRLSSLTASDKASLDVHIASPALFKRFGIERSSEVDNLDVTTTAGQHSGQVVVNISTRRPVREPFVDFLLEASTSNGSGLREYTVLLNPEGAATGNNAAQTTSPADGQATRAGHSQAPTRSSAQTAGATRGSGAGDSSYGPIRQGDTLSGIAAALRPPGVTTAQMTVALFNANPQAFAGGIDKLIRGARLNVPTAEDARAISSDNIRAQLGPTSTKSAPAGKAGNQSQQSGASASGESPPASLALQPAVKTASAEPADTASNRSAFGQLSMPRTDQWPQELAAKKPADDSKSGAVAAAGSAANDASEAAAEDVASSAGSKPSGASSADPANGDDTPPEDVTEGGESSWWSLRNLLLLLLLLVALGGGLMLRRRQQYKSVPMDFDGIDPDADEGTQEPSPSEDAVVEQSSETAAPPGSCVQRQQPASIQASQPQPTSPSGVRGGLRQSQENTGQGSTEPTDSDDFVPALLRHRTAGEQSDAPISDPESDTVATAEDEVQASDREHADAAATSSEDAPGRAAADYAFESQTVPAQPERQHDRGHDDEWAFDINPVSMDESTSQGDNGAAATSHRESDLIDPRAFSLDDSPASEGASDTALDSDTVAIRLDLANMYIEMEDLAMARDLLEEVIAQGDEIQKDKARSLLEQC